MCANGSRPVKVALLFKLAKLGNPRSMSRKIVRGRTAPRNDHVLVGISSTDIFNNSNDDNYIVSSGAIRDPISGSVFLYFFFL